MSCVFVLGSSGFIGSSLMTKLQDKGIVTTSVGIENSDIYLELGKCHDNLLDVVKKDDFVIFLAAISAPDICKNQKEFAESINVTATSDLISKLTEKGIRVIFSSTDVVFGLVEHAVNDESDISPFGEYGEMKAKVEKYFADNPLVKVIRFSYVMGPGDKYTDMLIHSSQSNDSVEVFDGFKRNVVALSDVTDGIYQLIKKWSLVPQGFINFSGPECVSRWQLTLAFSEKFCPDLKCSLIDAPQGFWAARPKKIEMTSSAFPELLGRKAKNINENITTWCN